jgi:transposase-like protein
MIGASSKEAEVGRRARVDRTPEQKLEIVLEGLKSGNITETCRRYEIGPNLYYGWKDEALQGASAALGGRSSAAAENEKDRRIRQLERSLGGKALEVEILKNVVGE